MPKNTLTVSGLNAVSALARVHPEKIERLFFDAETAPLFKETCQYLAGQRKVYRLVEPKELERLAKTAHHGGAVAVIPEPEMQAPPSTVLAAWPSTEKLVLALDGLSNSHNLGAMVRSAAYFGVRHFIVQKPIPGQDSLLTPTLWRVAEGGMEHVSLWFVGNLGDWLAKLKKGPDGEGFWIVAADQNARIPLHKFKRELPKGRIPMVVLGNEEKGLSAAIHRLADAHVVIPGQRSVESLNAAHAASILMWGLLF